MKYQIKFKPGAVLLLCFCIAGVKAQEIIPASGGEASGSGGTVCYTVGQLAYNMHTGANGSVREGVQQPYIVTDITGIDETNETGPAVSAYPNPTTDYLILQVDQNEIVNLSYQLLDINGRLLQNGEITGNKTSIVLNHLVPSTYFVKVIAKTQSVASQEVRHVKSNKVGAKQFNVVKTFKIIKRN
jgi:hypothetical protein